MLSHVKKYYFLIILIIAALLIYILPIDIPYSFESHAKILPSKEWILLKGADGFLLEGTKDILNGVNNYYRVNQFDRGATVDVRLRDSLLSGDLIYQGDTLGVIYSSANYQRYIALQGQIKTARAQLEAGTTGEKESVVRAAEENLKIALSEADRQDKIVKRLKSLNEKQLASDEEYQTAADILRSLNLTVEMRKSELEALKSGLKETELQHLKTYIESLTNDLKTLEQQISSFYITAPFSGYLERVFSTDTLLVLSDSENLLAAIPVPIEEETFLSNNTTAYLDMFGYEIKGSMIDVNRSVKLVGGKQCVTMICSIDEPSRLYSGMILKSSIEGKSVRLREYFRSMLDF